MDIQSEFALEQGYSIKVIDANPTNGDSMVEIYLNGEKVDSDMQFAKENKPYEYIKTVTDDDDRTCIYCNAGKENITDLFF